MAATAKKTKPAARGAYRVSVSVVLYRSKVRPVHASGCGRELQMRTGWWFSGVPHGRFPGTDGERARVERGIVARAMESDGRVTVFGENGNDRQSWQTWPGGVRA